MVAAMEAECASEVKQRYLKIAETLKVHFTVSSPRAFVPWTGSDVVVGGFVLGTPGLTIEVGGQSPAMGH